MNRIIVGSFQTFRNSNHKKKCQYSFTYTFAFMLMLDHIEVSLAALLPHESPRFDGTGVDCSYSNLRWTRKVAFNWNAKWSIICRRDGILANTFRDQSKAKGMSPYSYGKISKCYSSMCVLFAFTAGILL